MTKEQDNEKCAICGKIVCFDKINENDPPEYDICSSCDSHICCDCNVSTTVDPLCRACRG